MAGTGVQMDTMADSSTLTFFALIPATAMALVSSLVLLGRYRRSVVRLMSVRVPVPTTGPGTHRHLYPGPLRPVDRRLGPSLSAVLGHRRRLHIAIAVGAGLVVGLSYALLFLLWNGVEVTLPRYVLMALVFSWPAAPAAWVASNGDRRLTAWVAGVLLLAPLVVATTSGGGPRDALVLWAVFNAVATLVVAVFLTRGYRAVGVSLLGIWLAALLGAYTVTGTLGSQAVAQAALNIVPDASAVFWGTMLGGFVVAGMLGWLAFAALARWYARQGFSDHMLLLGSLCLVFCLEYVAVVSPGQPVLLLIGLTLFAVLGLLAFAAFQLLVPMLPAPAVLLVLRVFGDARTTGRLLDAVSAHWRHIGPVRLIAGPDLAVANVEPDEFLAYMTGGLRRRFIASPDDLARRLAESAPRPDPDGRYRVEEWFCLENAWRPTVEALLGGSDVVLMDLRGFTPQRQGTRYELELLVRTGTLDRTLLLIDDGTDLDHLEWILTGVGARGARMMRLDVPDPHTVVHALTA